MKCAYKFNSKHLGKAFMEELLEMGCEADVDKIDSRTTYFLYPLENKLVQQIHDIPSTYEKSFQLESQYTEALAFAKEQIGLEFKVEDWVYVERGNDAAVMKVKNDYSGYGFYDGEWIEDTDTSIGYFKDFGYDLVRKATKEEIETALIKEAKKRYNIPCKVKYIDGCVGSLGGYRLKYDAENDRLTASDVLGSDNRKDELYKQGKWAEIIEDKKFFDWDVEDTAGETKIGWQSFDKDFLQKFHDTLEYLDNKKTVKDILAELRQLDYIKEDLPF